MSNIYFLNESVHSLVLLKWNGRRTVGVGCCWFRMRRKLNIVRTCSILTKLPASYLSRSLSLSPSQRVSFSIPFVYFILDLSECAGINLQRRWRHPNLCSLRPERPDGSLHRREITWPPKMARLHFNVEDFWGIIIDHLNIACSQLTLQGL